MQSSVHEIGLFLNTKIEIEEIYACVFLAVSVMSNT